MGGGLAPASQGHNPALTVLYVPYSLDKGRGTRATSNVFRPCQQGVECEPLLRGNSLKEVKDLQLKAKAFRCKRTDTI